MTDTSPSVMRNRWVRIALAAVLVVTLAIGLYVAWPTRVGDKLTAYFTSCGGPLSR